MKLEWREATNSIGLLILRLGIGGFMATHGWGKVQMIAAGDFDKFGSILGMSSGVGLVLATGAEFLCALLVVVGLMTRLAAVPVVFTMGVAAFVVHGSDPWTMGKAAELFMAGQSESWASKEPALLYLIPFAALIFTGAGKFSIDAMIGRRKHSDESIAVS